jgi:PAS domain S-box-containing protein
LQEVLEIKHKELSFQLMVEASPIALILVNSFGKIAYLNGYTEKLFLYSKNELIGQDLGILLPEKFRSHHPELMHQYLKNPTSRQMGKNRDLYALKKDGTEFPVEIGLNPIVTVEGTLILAAVFDISDRIKASEQFRLVVESAPNAILLVDDTGKIVMINKQTEVLFGYTRDELIGKKMEILVPDRLKSHHPKLRNNFYSEPKARPMGAGRDLYGKRKDGTEIPVEIGLNPLEKDNARFVLASIIDITERKKNEEAIRLYTDRIEGKNKELEQFTYIASHDLREPLNSITGLIDVLIKNKSHQLDDDAKKLMNYILETSGRMTELITGLLDYSRLGKYAKLKKVDFNEMVNLAVSDLNSSFSDSGAKITVEKLPVLRAYEMEIRLLFQNLISNAIKYRKPGIDPVIDITARAVKNGWEFTVRDNGIGIPANQKEKIFIIFQRLHGRNEYEGTGIGLAHCRKILELHDGKIWVESEPDAGSTFNFFIPSKLA